VSDVDHSSTVPRLVWVAGVLGLVLAVVGGVLWVIPSRAGATQEDADTRQAIAQVTDFAVAYNTYDVADVKDYQQRVTGLLTDDYADEFVKITTALFEAIQDKKQQSKDAVVKDVAVQTIDEDSALVLAVVDAKVTNTDNDGAVPRQFRWTVNLQKVDGTWLVSQFESVAAQPADAPEPGAPEPGADAPGAGNATPSAPADQPSTPADEGSEDQ
jgi:hypothetical protein